MQGRLLADGMARVYTFADNRVAAATMLALEASARAAGRGIWRHPYYAVRHPEAARGDIGTFQVVAGRVVDAAEVRGRIYLNYGADWREDFTATLDPETARLFRGEGVEPLDLEGRRLRVRGWIQSYNGPMIEITHPEQIEVLNP